jgi:hypothetical protein
LGVHGVLASPRLRVQPLGPGASRPAPLSL